MITNAFKILIYLTVVIGLHPSLWAQPGCQTMYDSLQQTKTLAEFGVVNGPGSFKRQVEKSSITRTLRECPDFQEKAWADILTTVKSEKGDLVNKERRISIFGSDKVSSHTELKTAFLIVLYGYSSQADLQKVKEFVRTKPWRSGLIYASHLAVDVLLMRNNDPQRDSLYHTYTLAEMNRARELYTLE